MMSNAIYQFGNKEIGVCTVLVRHPPHIDNPTPEEVEQVRRNRRQINEALSRIESSAQGRPMEVTVDFRDDLYQNGVPETLADLKRIAEKMVSA